MSVRGPIPQVPANPALPVPAQQGGRQNPAPNVRPSSMAPAAQPAVQAGCLSSIMSCFSKAFSALWTFLITCGGLCNRGNAQQPQPNPVPPNPAPGQNPARGPVGPVVYNEDLAGRRLFEIQAAMGRASPAEGRRMVQELIMMRNGLSAANIQNRGISNQIDLLQRQLEIEVIPQGDEEPAPAPREPINVEAVRGELEEFERMARRLNEEDPSHRAAAVNILRDVEAIQGRLDAANIARGGDHEGLNRFAERILENVREFPLLGVQEMEMPREVRAPRGAGVEAPRNQAAAPGRRRCQIRPERHRVAIGAVGERAAAFLPNGCTFRIGNRVVILKHGNLLQEPVRAIVNAANEGGVMGGGIDGVINRAAGPDLIAERQLFEEIRPGVRLPTGQAFSTGGHNIADGMMREVIIHTAGPDYRQVQGQAADQHLYNSVYNSLEEAEARGVTSIGFCAISQGIFAFPTDRATQIFNQAFQHFFQDRPQSVINEVRVVYGNPRAYQGVFNVWANLQNLAQLPQEGAAVPPAPAPAARAQAPAQGAAPAAAAPRPVVPNPAEIQEWVGRINAHQEQRRVLNAGERLHYALIRSHIAGLPLDQRQAYQEAIFNLDTAMLWPQQSHVAVMYFMASPRRAEAEYPEHVRALSARLQGLSDSFSRLTVDEKRELWDRNTGGDRGMFRSQNARAVCEEFDQIVIALHTANQAYDAAVQAGMEAYKTWLGGELRNRVAAYYALNDAHRAQVLDNLASEDPIAPADLEAVRQACRAQMRNAV